MSSLTQDVWHYSADHKQPCQVIETQRLWGETICRVWLPGRDSVVRIPVSRLKPLDNAGTGSSDYIAYSAAAARVPQEEKTYHEQLEQKAHIYPDMVPLMMIRIGDL